MYFRWDEKNDAEIHRCGEKCIAGKFPNLLRNVRNEAIYMAEQQDTQPVDPSPETEKKLELLYQIPHRERATLSEAATSEASFSSDHTPSMSSTVPKSAAEFSLADLKATIVKKEKYEETPAPKPVHVPTTRSKISARKRKAVDSVTQLESFEGMSAVEVKDLMHSSFSILHLGFDQLHELLKNQEEELLASKKAYDDLKKLGQKKEGQYKLKEEAFAKELEEFKVRAEEKEKLLVKEAKRSAATTVYESKYEMAKEAKAAGFSLPHWDLQGWAAILGKEEKLSQADSKAPEAAADMEVAGGGAVSHPNRRRNCRGAMCKIVQSIVGIKVAIFH